MEEAKAREVREFELVSMGLERGKDNNNRAREEYDYSRKRKVEEAATAGSGGVDVEVGKRRRLSSLNEKGISPEERENIRRELKREKVWFLLSILAVLPFVNKFHIRTVRCKIIYPLVLDSLSYARY